MIKSWSFFIDNIRFYIDQKWIKFNNIKIKERDLYEIFFRRYRKCTEISTTTIKSREKYIRSFLKENNKFSVPDVQDLKCMYDFEDETENEKNIRINMEKAEEANHIKDAIKYTKKAMKYAKDDIEDFD